MTRQFIRKVSLIVANGGEGLDLSESRFTFRIKQADIQNPQSAVISVYNLSDDTAKRLADSEFTRVILQAGYEEGNFGLIFDGTIIQPLNGRDNPTDSYVKLIAAEGDEFITTAFVNGSMSAGASQMDVIKFLLANSQNAAGTLVNPNVGYIPVQAGATLPRGKVLYGMTRDALHIAAATAGQSYFIKGSQINFVPLDGIIPGQAVLVNTDTGMIGWPIQTQDGVEVTTLLNPLLAIGSTLKIDNKSILQAQLSAAYTGPNSPNLQAQSLPQLDHDGLYKVHVIEHMGDTRGNDWYSKMVCLSVDPSNARLTGLIARGQY